MKVPVGSAGTTVTSRLFGAAVAMFQNTKGTVCVAVRSSTRWFGS